MVQAHRFEWLILQPLESHARQGCHPVIEEQLPNNVLSQEPGRNTFCCWTCFQLRELPSSCLTQHDVVERRSLVYYIGRQEEHKSTRCSPRLLSLLQHSLRNPSFVRILKRRVGSFSAHMASAPSYSPPIAPGVVLQLMLPSLLPSAPRRRKDEDIAHGLRIE
jgi:hypothetical protein